MSDPVLGNAARWHATSPLYGEEPHTTVAVWPDSMWREHRRDARVIGETVSRAYVVTLHGGERGGAIIDAHRHDL